MKLTLKVPKESAERMLLQVPDDGKGFVSATLTAEEWAGHFTIASNKGPITPEEVKSYYARIVGLDQIKRRLPDDNDELSEMFRRLGEDRGIWFPLPRESPSIWLDCILEFFAQDPRHLSLLLDKPEWGWMRLGMLFEELFPDAYDNYMRRIEPKAPQEVLQNENLPGEADGTASESLRRPEASIVFLDRVEPPSPAGFSSRERPISDRFNKIGLPW